MTPEHQRLPQAALRDKLILGRNQEARILQLKNSRKIESEFWLLARDKNSKYKLSHKTNEQVTADEN